MQVYVSAAKRKVMEALNLPQEYKVLLTTDDKAALLHAVPLWRVSLKHMARVLKHYRGRYNTIVGFQPTGWSMQKGQLLQTSLLQKDMHMKLLSALKCSMTCNSSACCEHYHEVGRIGFAPMMKKHLVSLATSL